MWGIIEAFKLTLQNKFNKELGIESLEYWVLSIGVLNLTK